MSELGLVKYSYLAYFSQPAADRTIYRELNKRPARTIVEIGVGDMVRAQRLIEMSAAGKSGNEIRYTGIDLFEARPADAPGVTLKHAYKTLRRLPAKIQLIPGDPFSALSRSANELTGTDLIIIAADQDSDAVTRAVAFLPRMIHPDSLVFHELQQGSQTKFERWTASQIDAMAGKCRRAAA